MFKKAPKFLWIIMLALATVTISCNKNDDDDDDDNQTNVTNLTGNTWTFGFDGRMARIVFSQSDFSISGYDEPITGPYSYDGETLSWTFIYDYDDKESFKLYCLTKADNPFSLQGTVWKFEMTYDGGRIYSYTINLYENTYTIIEDGYGEYESGYYSYDGNTIAGSFEGDSFSLQCGRILYEMSKNHISIW